jgi:ferredoxin
MKLSVDPNKCQGHGRCYALAPDLFDLDDIGNASAREPEISEDRRADAELAAANCPESAITVG